MLRNSGTAHKINIEDFKKKPKNEKFAENSCPWDFAEASARVHGQEFSSNVGAMRLFLNVLKNPKLSSCL
jgi:hypothetical protein